MLKNQSPNLLDWGFGLGRIKTESHYEALEKMMNRQTGLKLIAYLNICILWGSSNVVTKIGVSGLHPFQFAALRFLTAGLLLSLIMALTGKKFTFTKKEWRILLTIGLVMNFLTNGCVVLSNSMIDSGIVTLLLATIPIFAALLEIFVLKSYRLSRRMTMGLTGGFMGIAIVALCGSGSLKASLGGILIALLAAVFWSLGSIYSRQNIVKSCSPIVHTAVETLFAGSIFLALSFATHNFSFEKITVSSMLPIIYLAVFDSIIGFISYIYLLKVMPAAQVCTYAYINPVVALLLGYFILNESLNAGKLIGMAIIIVSVMLIQSGVGKAETITQNPTTKEALR